MLVESNRQTEHEPKPYEVLHKGSSSLEGERMNPFSRLIRADQSRKTRFHTSNGHLCLNPIEIAVALATTTNRVVFKKYHPAPWLVFSATKYIEQRLAGRRVFEFGSGMSTLWFSDRCATICSVESDERWYNASVAKLEKRSNASVIYAPSKRDYLRTIAATGAMFDLIVIDGLYRTECVEIAQSHLRRDGMLIVDNTDVDPALSKKVSAVFGNAHIQRFRGWMPGNLHASETTVVETRHS